MSVSRRRFVAAAITSPPVERATAELDTLTNAFAVHCPRSLLAQIMDHAVRYRNTEVFGILLGHVVSMEGGRIRTVVTDYVPATTFLESRASYVEVSAAELLRMHEACEPRITEQNLRTVGWFHTHPGHGIFMSTTDRDNHRLYAHPWQVALVLDPQSEQWGFFVGAECRSVSADLVVVGSEPAPAERPKPDPGATGDLATVASAAPAGGAARSATLIAAQSKWLLASSCMVLAGTIGLLIVAAMLGARLRVQQALLEEENARIRDLQLRIDDLSSTVCVPH